MQALHSLDPNSPPLATRIQIEGDDVTYRVTKEGRKVYGDAKVIMLTLTPNKVDVRRIL